MLSSEDENCRRLAVSPFSKFLIETRKRRGLGQGQLAMLLGYEQSYLSAIERSKKRPPKQDFIERLIRGLSFNDEEKSELAKALEKSRRQVRLPCSASLEEYELLHELEPRVGHLCPAQIEIIRQVLNLTSHADAGVGRRSHLYPEEDISSLERGQKGPPRKDFIDRLIRRLALSESEQAELSVALHASKRQISLPCPADEAEYHLIRELEPQLGHLRPVQIELIRLALSLPAQTL